MAKYIKLFNNHSQYEGYTAATQSFILPNVSYCKNVAYEVHYNPLRCDGSSVYEIVGTPSYPSIIDGVVTFFDVTINYKRTDIDTACTKTVTEGTDIITVECGMNTSTSSTRTVNGTLDYYGNEIEYSVTQRKFEAKVTAKFNITDTSNPTLISYEPYSSFNSIEIDGVMLETRPTEYIFNTTGEHTVKYYLKDTVIRNAAFKNCSDITSIDIPDGVTSIANEVFESCSGITSCTIGNTLATIGERAFIGCGDMISINIPDGVTSIGQGAFSGCKSLTSIEIPSSVTSIASHTFGDCTSLTSIVIPDSVTTIDFMAFSDCSSLSSCTIGSGVTSIATEVFESCSSLKSITIPDSVTSMGHSVFRYCISLTDVTLGNGLITIPSYAFDYCISLTSATIGSGVTIISESAFNDCRSLTSIGSVGSGASIEIPSGITSIGVDAFIGCNGLTSVTIPDSVTSISGWAFANCTSLISVTVESTTPPTLGASVFDDTNDCAIYVPTCSLVDVYCSASDWSYYTNRITAIDCPTVTAKFNVTSTSSPTQIGYRQFISGFSSIEIDDVEQPTVISAYTFSTTGEHTVKYHLRNATIVVASFFQCKNIVSCIINDSVTNIERDAFYGCESLTSIVIPDSITSIEDSTFGNCGSMTSCTIGSGVISIGNSAFTSCSGLTSIEIPSGVTSIGEKAFSGCTSLSGIISNALIAPTIQSDTFQRVNTYGTLYVPIGSSGYDTWMQNTSYYLRYYGWTKVEQ